MSNVGAHLPPLGAQTSKRRPCTRNSFAGSSRKVDISQILRLASRVQHRAEARERLSEPRPSARLFSDEEDDEGSAPASSPGVPVAAAVQQTSVSDDPEPPSWERVLGACPPAAAGRAAAGAAPALAHLRRTCGELAQRLLGAASASAECACDADVGQALLAGGWLPTLCRRWVPFEWRLTGLFAPGPRQGVAGGRGAQLPFVQGAQHRTQLAAAAPLLLSLHVHCVPPPAFTPPPKPIHRDGVVPQPIMEWLFQTLARSDDATVRLPAGGQEHDEEGVASHAFRPREM